jgi:XTP/dITP diphosphohydrolase
MKIYLASGNAHKVQEFQALADAAKAAGGVALEFISSKTVGGMPAVEEDTGTFIGNARKKAQALKAKLESEASPVSKDALWVLADDSGLCVDALGGAPGVESAYYAGPKGDPAANLRKLIEVMREVPARVANAQRSTLNVEHLGDGESIGAEEPLALPGKVLLGRAAHFVCVLVLLGPGGVEKIFEGQCDGTLLVEPRGGTGFGYDPLFVPTGKTESLAEMGEALKNQISHRARAAQRLMEWLKACN